MAHLIPIHLLDVLSQEDLHPFQFEASLGLFEKCEFAQKRIDFQQDEKIFLKKLSLF